MPTIRPVSDLRNHFAEITREAETKKEPIFLTKNGVGSIVVMSMEAYEENLYESEVYDKLKEAELRALESDYRLSREELMERARTRLDEIKGGRERRA